LTTRKQKLLFVAPKAVSSSKQTISDHLYDLVSDTILNQFEIERIDSEEALYSVNIKGCSACFVSIENHRDSLFALNAINTLNEKGFAGRSLAYVHDFHFPISIDAKEVLSGYDYVFASSLVALSQIEAGNVSASYLPFPVVFKETDCRSTEQLHVAYCGGFGVEFRADKLLLALKDFGEKVKIFWMTFDVSKAKALCKQYEFESVEFIESYSYERWRSLCAEANVIAIPNVSALISSGPLLPIALASGNEIVVSDFAEAGDLPDEAVGKIEIGYSEEENFRSFFRGVLNEKSVSKSEFARKYAKEVHSLELFSELVPYLTP